MRLCTCCRKPLLLAVPPALVATIVWLPLTVASTSPVSSDAGDMQTQQLLKTFASEFVPVTPGTGRFPMPPRKMSGFAISKFETTQNLYEAVMGENPSRWKGPRNSVESMTWLEAESFCRRVTNLMRSGGLLKPDEEIRLPSEAEWEYCCRAGTQTAYSFGERPTADGDQEPRATRLDAYAWHHGNAAGNDPAVGVLKPNPWGLFDMHGYLWEYTSDLWHPEPGKATRPRPGANQRTIRGGSWRDHYSQLTSSSRWPVPDHTHSDAIGFRCVRAQTQN